MWGEYTEREAGRQNETRSHRYKGNKISASLVESTANTWADNQAQSEASFHAGEHRRNLLKNSLNCNS
jgi:hypothetical protein